MNDLGGLSYPADPIPTQEERNWALLAHLSPVLASTVGAGPIGPLIVYLIKKNDSPFAAKSALQALAFSIGVYVFAIVMGMIGFVLTCAMGLGLLILIPLGTLLPIAYLVYVILAMIRASDGMMYEYPITAKFVK